MKPRPSYRGAVWPVPAGELDGVTIATLQMLGVEYLPETIGRWATIFYRDRPLYQALVTGRIGHGALVTGRDGGARGEWVESHRIWSGTVFGPSTAGYTRELDDAVRSVLGITAGSALTAGQVREDGR